MMLNAQKTISPSSEAANFKRHFGRFIANRSRVVCASKRSREKRTVRSHKDAISDGDDFIAVREPPKDPRAISLKAQLDDLSLHLAAKPNRLATMKEAFRIQTLVENILAKTL